VGSRGFTCVGDGQVGDYPSLMALNSSSWRTFGARRAPARLRGITPCAAPAASGVMNPLWDSPLPDLRGTWIFCAGICFTACLIVMV